MGRQNQPRKTYVVLDVPELDFIPQYDREGTSRSPEGVLTNKLFKYMQNKGRARALYAQLMDTYGIGGLVGEKRPSIPARTTLQPQGEQISLF